MGQKGSEVLWSGEIPSRFRLDVGGMGCTRAVLETLNEAAGEDVGWRATHSGFMLRKWMGPCLTGSGQPWDVSPRAVVSSGAVEGKRQVQPRGVGTPLHPTVTAAALVSLPGRWQLPLWHLGPALFPGAFGVAGAVPEMQQLSLWLRGGSDLFPRHRLCPPGRFPKPAAVAELRGGGGCSCRPSQSRRRSGPR